MEFLIIADIFAIFLPKLEIYCHGRFAKLSLLTNWIFFCYLGNTFLEQTV